MNQQKQTEKKSFAANVYDLFHDVIYLMLAATLIFTFAVRMVGVVGSSMYPTLVGKQSVIQGQGDYVLLLSNGLNTTYRRGDIVVACLPGFRDGQEPIIKRVIGTPGQVVDLQDNGDGTWCVTVDGEALTEPYINGQMIQTMYQTIEFPATVPEHSYFCMGDNRNNSLDSRSPEIGMIDTRYIIGRGLVLLFPGVDTADNSRTWSRIGILK